MEITRYTLLRKNDNLWVFQNINGPQVGDRFSFSGSSVDVKFTSDYMNEAPGFSFVVVDGYESANDIINLSYAQKRINPEDLPEKEILDETI